MVGLRIFPGSGLARRAEAEGLLDPATDFLEPVFYLAPEVKDRVVEIAGDGPSIIPTGSFRV
jgi:hypothetical protein